jgi:hypothetical protein
VFEKFKRNISPHRAENHLTLLRELQKVMSNHQELVPWTLDVNGALSELARQIVNIGAPITEEDEWEVAEGDGQIES